jgi:urocanate hydratase
MAPVIRAPRGTTLRCRGWKQEAALRMLMNNLDPDVAERPADLVVYGGTGKAARDWPSFHAIVRELESLASDETLLVQSGRPVGVFRTHEEAPRVLIANANLVGHWSNWEQFRALEKLGLTMYGQMTAGSWIYIGSQGILQGTYETFAAAARKHFGGSLAGRLVVTGGLGGMGGAQPLAATMNGAALLGIEVDPARIRKRIETGYCDAMTDSLDEALAILRAAMDAGAPKSVGLVANCAEALPEMARRGIVPDILTDQTSAHDPLNGYIPAGLTVEQAAELRARDPQQYLDRSLDSIATHVRAMLDLQRAGAVTFDYGNNIRRFAADRGVADAFKIPGFVPEYIRPLFCEGRGPFRWVALSGEPSDIAATDQPWCCAVRFQPSLTRWISLAAEARASSRACRRASAGWATENGRSSPWRNEPNGGDRQAAAPIVIGRDHLDCGSVASPYRETEDMLDGQRRHRRLAAAERVLNTASGASWVSVHNGGGVGIGYSQHAGQVTVADGTDQSARCLERVMTCDPGIGVLRHVDAGYQEAIDFAGPAGLRAPMRSAE